MDIKEILALVPDDKKEAAQKALGEHGAVNADKVKAFLITDEGKKILQPGFPPLDSIISTAITNHDKKFETEKLPGILESEIKKRFPDKTPEQKELAEIKAKLETEQKERIKSEQRSKAIKLLSDAGLPSFLADRFYGQSDEETAAAIESLKQELTPWRDEAVKKKDDEWLARGGVPGGGDDEKKNAITQEQLEKLPPKEQAAYFESGGALK